MNPGIGQKSERTRVLQLIREGVRPEVVAQSQDVPLEKVREYMHGKPRKPLRRPPRSPRRQRSISPASPQQRAKVKDKACIVCRVSGGPAHPAHLIDRSLARDEGDPRAVVPLCPDCHRAYDEGDLSLLEHLEPHYREELAFAVERVGLLSTLQRVTNERWQPLPKEKE